MINELRSLAKGRNVIVVEGEKDRKALKELGIEGTFIVMHGSFNPRNIRMERFVEEGYSFIILSDFDRRGEELGRLTEEYLKGRANVHEVFRRRFRGLINLNKAPKSLEGLGKWLNRQFEKFRVGGVSHG